MGYGFVILLVGIALFVGYLWGSQKKFVGKNSLDQGRSLSMATAHLEIHEKQEIQRLIQQNKKIQAIKRYRNITGCGLKEAKEAIDQIQYDGDR